MLQSAPCIPWDWHVTIMKSQTFLSWSKVKHWCRYALQVQAQIIPTPIQKGQSGDYQSRDMRIRQLSDLFNHGAD